MSKLKEGASPCTGPGEEGSTVGTVAGTVAVRTLEETASGSSGGEANSRISITSREDGAAVREVRALRGLSEEDSDTSESTFSEQGISLHPS